MSWDEADISCGACGHRNRKCAPDCMFHLCDPPIDSDQFALLDKVFGASNVDKLLAELKPQARRVAVISLYIRALDHEQDPTLDRAAAVTFLRNMLRRARGEAAVARIQFEVHAAAPAPAIQLVDAAVAPPVAEQNGEASGSAGEQDDDAKRLQERRTYAAVVAGSSRAPRGRGQSAAAAPQEVHTAALAPAIQPVEAMPSEKVPCGVCAHLNRECGPDCRLLLYFPPDEFPRFALLDRVFGGSNVVMLLDAVTPTAHFNAVNSLLNEATEREHDPAFDRAAAVTFLQNVLRQTMDDDAVASVQFEVHATAPAPAIQENSEAPGLAGEQHDDATRLQAGEAKQAEMCLGLPDSGDGQQTFAEMWQADMQRDRQAMALEQQRQDEQNELQMALDQQMSPYQYQQRQLQRANLTGIWQAEVDQAARKLAEMSLRHADMMIKQIAAAAAAAAAHGVHRSRSGATPRRALQTCLSANAPSFHPSRSANAPPSQSQQRMVNAPASHGQASRPPRQLWLPDVPHQHQNDGDEDEGQSSDRALYFRFPYPDRPPDRR